MSDLPDLPSWHIRAASDGDLDALLAIETLAFDAPWSATSLQSELTRPQSCVYLASVAEEPIAYTTFHWLLDECELLRLAVVPKFRRRRLGQRMLEHGLEALYLRGCRQCHLEVRDDNLAARRLYETLGFEVTGRRKDYYRQGDRPMDAVLYRLAMTSEAFEEGR